MFDVHADFGLEAQRGDLRSRTFVHLKCYFGLFGCLDLVDLTYSFMEDYDPAWSPNEGDSALRYAFQNQPDVAAWNCERLAEAFSCIVGESTNFSTHSVLVHALSNPRHEHDILDLSMLHEVRPSLRIDRKCDPEICFTIFCCLG